MKHTEDPRNPDLKAGDQKGGFRIEKVMELPEINGFYYELKHLPTGAAHIHISREDSENAFSVVFKTVPADSTGVAHILEHTVLCGSRNYPVRDPFFSMMKRSLSTFMNALTASDWTMYPFATQNEKDFYNLMSVYLDAAFFPRIDELSFKQEGHRLEFETDPADGRQHLVYKGVVFNEMKGAMSSPDQVMGRSLLNALYPDTTYSNNSGGEPEQIPQLTHEQLKAFHARHYHPSNAYFYTYGNLPLARHLEFIEDTVLCQFSPIDPATGVPSQPRWSEPKTAVYSYPMDPEETTDKKAQACVAWLTADIREAYEVLVLSVLEQVLLGNPGAPLRKALMDSQLGSTLSDGSGLDADNKDTLFACGLKDVNAEDGEKIEKIIFEVLSDLAENGIERRLVESAIHQIEFHRKEVTNTPFPYGIKLLLRFCGDWLHQGQPDVALQFDSLVTRFFQELEATDLLENRIRKYFISNPHRVRMTLEPDPELYEKRRAREEQRLSAIEKDLTEDDREKIQQDAQKLVQLQESQEDLSCLPMLSKTDIAPDIRVVHPSGVVENPPVELYEQPSSGILYCKSVFGIQNLEPDLIDLLPLFCHAMTQTGTADYDYVELARRIDQYTGGLGFSVSASRIFSQSSAGCLPVLNFSGKCLSRNISSMFDLIRDLVSRYAFSDTDRLRDLLLEVRAEMESSVVHNGHRLAMSLAARNYSTASALNETWHGIHQIKTIKNLTADLDTKKLKALAANLERIAGTVFHENNVRTALIGEPADLESALPLAKDICQKMPPAAGCGFEPPDFAADPEIPREGWATATAVSFVAKVIETRPMDHPDAPVLAVISKLLKSMFLHREIREKGGAYGGFSLYQMENGQFYFGSYRDPHIVRTLQVYDAAADFITSGDYDRENIEEAVLQVCADLDRPDPPGPAAFKAFYRRLIGLSDELRRNFKQGVLEVDLEQVRNAADKYFSTSGTNAAVAVISSQDLIEEANRQLGDRALIPYRI